MYIEYTSIYIHMCMYVYSVYICITREGWNQLLTWPPIYIYALDGDFSVRADTKDVSLECQPLSKCSRSAHSYPLCSAVSVTIWQWVDKWVGGWEGLHIHTYARVPPWGLTSPIYWPEVLLTLWYMEWIISFGWALMLSKGVTGGKKKGNLCGSVLVW